MHRAPLRLAPHNTPCLLWEHVGVNKLGHLVSWRPGMLQQDCLLSVCDDPIPARLVTIVFRPASRFTQLPHPDQWWRAVGADVLMVHSCVSASSVDVPNNCPPCSLDDFTVRWGALHGQSLSTSTIISASWLQLFVNIHPDVLSGFARPSWTNTQRQEFEECRENNVAAFGINQWPKC